MVVSESGVSGSGFVCGWFFLNLKFLFVGGCVFGPFLVLFCSIFCHVLVYFVLCSLDSCL